MRHLAPVAFSLLLAACSASPPTQGTPVPIDQDFPLAVGASVTVSGTDLALRFVQVGDDSRCPLDAQCVTAGDATVRLSAREDRGRELPIDLRVNGEANEARFGIYWIRLQDLTPLPRAGQPVPPRDYVATLRVRRS